MPDDDKKVTDDELNAELLDKTDDDKLKDDDLDDDNVIKPDDDVNKLKADDKTDKKDDDDKIDWENELNKARSDWGRKQKATDTKIESLTDSVAQLVEVVKTGATGQNQQAGNDIFESEEPIPLTMGDLAKTMQKMMNNQNQQITGEQQTYQDDYLKTVERLGSTYTDKVHQHIVERMHKDFNNKHSDNPALDAELNFSKAEATILREVRSRKENPLDKNKKKDTKNLGGSNNVAQDSSSISPVKLDEYAADFIKSTGMKEEDAQKALQGDIPLSLRGKVTV